MAARTIPAMQSVDSTLEAAELVSDAQYPDACKAVTVARSEKVTIREIPMQRFRRCTPPVRSMNLGRYFQMLNSIERTR